MKIRNLDELNDKLSEDLAWRKKELAAMKSLIEQRTVSPDKHIFSLVSNSCFNDENLIATKIYLEIYIHIEGNYRRVKS